MLSNSADGESPFPKWCLRLNLTPWPDQAMGDAPRDLVPSRDLVSFAPPRGTHAPAPRSRDAPASLNTPLALALGPAPRLESGATSRSSR